MAYGHVRGGGVIQGPTSSPQVYSCPRQDVACAFVRGHGSLNIVHAGLRRACLEGEHVLGMRGHGCVGERDIRVSKRS